MLKELLADRLFNFDVERAVFLTVLHRLLVCGSDRFCDKWRSDYLIEERLFPGQRHLFTGLDLVFFDTTSLYFEGQGGESLGKRGFSKDHRPDLNQMVVGAILDGNGRPICCEMWPGNTTDVVESMPTEVIRGMPNMMMRRVSSMRRRRIEAGSSKANLMP